jgi:hypothetical protein
LHRGWQGSASLAVIELNIQVCPPALFLSHVAVQKLISMRAAGPKRPKSMEKSRRKIAYASRLSATYAQIYRSGQVCRVISAYSAINL